MTDSGCIRPQVEGIQQTLDSILADLGDVYDAFMILWWRVVSGARLVLTHNCSLHCRCQLGQGVTSVNPH